MRLTTSAAPVRRLEVLGVLALIALAGAVTAAAAQTRSDAPRPERVHSDGASAAGVMEVLAPRRAEVTDEQLDRLAELQLEAIFAALGDYRFNYAEGFRSTQPGTRIVGRALTMRYMPPRPDVTEALTTLAEESGRPLRGYARAAEEAEPGDIIVVDLGGADGNLLFGDMGALGLKMRGARGVIIDGGTRDLAELRAEAFAGFPVFARYFTIQNSSWYAVDYDAPVKIGNAIVLPGDVVIADEAGAIFFPPELVDQVLERAAARGELEAYERELIREGEHPFDDVYPLSEELRREYERRRRTPDPR